MDTLGMLHLLKAEPTLMPVAPDDASGEDIERRRRDEVHACLACGERATTALLVQDPHGTWQGKRWLDLCWKDFTRVRTSA
ncbi:hypothetical protein [Streptomyces himalayensis]|uniref:Uncharacterized protein n=1 Tax=Streptomyces himalayensis subsp. himalayensis TaxID=2756131 RepID=A0A7W0IDQ1_9ACTN|nr:hypothetical protein [Streptomyces himalayensis]MBA2951978.1 hypothetical protein [Streptomyces himalayensis subsp. himalayensis]